jgi:cysteine desulfurase / selenocysteine lyase
MNQYRSDFPLLVDNPNLVYLDSASTSQKPRAVINSVVKTYQTKNANVQRSLYTLGHESTEAFEAVRTKTAEFISATHADEIIFTSGATEAANLVAQGWAKQNLRRGDIVVISSMEHHSNFVPWLRLRHEAGVHLQILPFYKDYRLQFKLNEIDLKKVKLLALTHVSNVLGTVNPISEIVAYFKQHGPNDLRVFIDAAQSAPHLPISVADLQADFIVFSSHKMFGPSGTGVLYAARRTHDRFEPLLTGSHMVDVVNLQNATWAPVPDRFEAGTPNIEGVIGFGAALDYISSVGWDQLAQLDLSLNAYALEQLLHIPKVTLYGPRIPEQRLGIFSFNIDGVHPHDVAEIANRHHVCVRAGQHCAQPLMQQLGIQGTVRASTHLYNTAADIDVLVDAIKDAKKVFRK